MRAVGKYGGARGRGRNGGLLTFVWSALHTFQDGFPVEEIILFDGPEMQKSFIGVVGVVLQFPEETLGGVVRCHCLSFSCAERAAAGCWLAWLASGEWLECGGMLGVAD